MCELYSLKIMFYIEAPIALEDLDHVVDRQGELKNRSCQSTL